MRHNLDPKVMDRVREIVWNTNMTYKALGAALGLNYNTISSWMSGRCEISTEGLRRLCQFAHRSADEVLGIPKKQCQGCRWRGVRHQKCSCCDRNPSIKDCYEGEKM